jgi:hypothetical protein
MAKLLQVVLWSANGLTKYTEELKTFISINNVDIILISEANFTEKSYLKHPKYTVYHTSDPAGTARGGTAIVIKISIKHHQLNNYNQHFLQANSVSVEDSVGLLTISAVYLPPKHTVKQEQLEDFYNSLGRRFIAGEDYIYKHTNCGSRLITPWGREVLWKETTSNTYIRESPHTGHLTGINYMI